MIVTFTRRHAVVMSLPLDVAAPCAARHSIDADFQCLGPAAKDDARVVIGELVTNAVLHGALPIMFRAELHDRCIRLEVEDGEPAMGPATESSHGLAIVGMLASAWGVAPAESGKTVWAEVPRPTP